MCNTFNNCRYAINLSDRHTLRDPFQTHGILGTESRSNNYRRSEYSDIHRTNTVRDWLNWWVIETGGNVKQTCFNEGSSVKCYSGSNMLLPSLIRGYAPDFCEGNFPTGSSTFTPANTDSIQELNLKWELEYVNSMVTASQNATNNYTPKERIILAINNIQLLDYATAYQLLNFTFTDILDLKMATILKLLVNLNYPEQRDLTTQEKSNLYEIANLVPSLNGSYVYLARSIIKNMFDDNFGEVDVEYKDMQIQLINGGCVTNSDNIIVTLYDNANNQIDATVFVDSNLKVTIFGEDLVHLDSLGTYRVKIVFMGNEQIITNSFFQLMNNNIIVNLGCSTNLGKTGKLIVYQQDSTIKVSPNPFNELINILSNDAAFQNYTIQIFDISGRLVYFDQAKSKNNTVDVSNLISGMYILKLTNMRNEYKHYNLIKN